MLTGVQAVRLALVNTRPPSRLSDVHKLVGLPKLSMRALIDGLEKRKITIWLHVASGASIDFSTVKSRKDMFDRISNAPELSRADLVTLANLLKTNGLSLVLSKVDRKTIGIHGTTAAFANSGGGLHILDDAAFHVGQGIAVIGTAISAFGAVSANPFVVAVGIGFAGVGGIVMILGAIDVLNFKPPEPPATEKPNPAQSELDFPDDSLGDPPKDIADAIASGLKDIDKFIVGDPSTDIPEDIGDGSPGGDGAEGTGFPGDGGIGFG